MMIPMRQNLQKNRETENKMRPIELGYWSDSDSRSLGSITDKEHNTEYPEFICRRYGVLQRNLNLRVRKVFRMQSIPVRNGMENLRMPIVNWPRFWTVSELFRMI